MLDYFDQLLALAPLEAPRWLLLIPIIIFLLFFLLRTNVVKVTLDNIQERKRKKMRWIIFFSRSIVFTLILIALATPFAQIQEETSGDPEITILVDESKSMEVLETAFVEELEAALSQEIPTTVRTIARDENSNIGDGILDNLEPGKQVLLISDGNVQKGTSLSDVAFFANNNLNASISAIQLDAKEEDAAVSIQGPNKVVAGTSNNYLVSISASHNNAVPVRVLIDGQVVFDETTRDRTLAFEKEFTIGTHKIEARIGGNDYFSQNNEFYKTVTVLEKPRILLLSNKDTPVEGILNELYTVTKRNSIPQDLSEYYAIVANDVPASSFTDPNAIHEFLLDEEGGFFGGGMVVIGGFNSYDRGGYQNSPIESMLPVTVGKGEQKKGDDNIVIVLDISGGSTGIRYEQECEAPGNCRWVEVVDEVSALDIIKAQTLNLIGSEKNILATNKVGVIAFGAQGTVESPDQDYQAADTVKIIEPLDYLYNNQGRIKENIPRLRGGGPSEIGIALQTAYGMLSNRPGQNNYVLLLTDGNVGPSIQNQAGVVVSNLRKQGIQVFTYGVGRNEQNVMSDFLSTLAEMGDGLYEGPVFTTRDVNPSRISIKWGDPDQKGFGDEFGLITFSLTHFITRDLELSATLNGFNQVAPKSTAKQLLVTDFGQPALTTMNYGNGRVAALSVFTGSGLGELLNADNSVAITRTVNWAIGDPERKQDFFVDIGDARIGEQITATIKSDETINDPNIELIRNGDSYTAYFTSERVGFNTFFGAEYATNYVKEYQNVGMSAELNATVEATQGKLFSPEDTNAIIEHVTAMSKQQIVERKVVRWPFLSLALLIFLLEIFIRRVYVK